MVFSPYDQYGYPDDPNDAAVKAAIMGVPPPPPFDPTQGMTPTGLYQLPPMPPPNDLGDEGVPPPSYRDEEGSNAGLRRALAGYQTMEHGGIPVSAQAKTQASRLKELMEPGPLEQRFLDALAGGPEPVHGFKAHLLGALRGFALGAAQGNGLGGIGGAIYGAFDPNLMNRAMYRVQASGLAGPAEFERQSRNDRLKRAAELAGLTGVDPITGEQTPAAAYKDYMARAGMDRIDIQRANSQSLTKSREVLNETRQARMRQIEEKYANEPFENFIKAYNAGILNNDPDRMAAFAMRAGIENPDTIQPKVLAGMLKTIVDEKYGVNTLNLQTGEVKSTGMTSSQATTEKGRAQGRAETQRHNRATEEARGTMTDAQIEANIPHKSKDIEKGVPNKETSILTGKAKVLTPEQQQQNKEYRDRMAAENEAYRQQQRALRVKARAQGTAQSSPKAVIPASSLAQKLNDPAIVAMGIKDVNALRKALVDQGYAIDESK